MASVAGKKQPLSSYYAVYKAAPVLRFCKVNIFVLSAFFM